ncbi:MAG: carbohydrate-binding domain-containing protein [Armatimonadota bacterium]
MHVRAWGSNRRGAGRLQTTGRHVKTLGLTAILVLALSSSLLAQGLYPIYGIHFWSPSASSGPIQIQNGRQMWTVEMLYTTQAKNWDINRWVDEYYRLAAIQQAGFRIILRVDYHPSLTIPPTNDWAAKQEFASMCQTFAAWFSPFVHAMIIGNELKEYPNSPISAEWYAKVFNNADPSDFYTVYRLVKAQAPNMLVGIYAPGGWPGESDLRFWRRVLDSVKKDANGRPQIDCFPLHAYSGASTVRPNSPVCPETLVAENPRFASGYDFNGFIPYIKEIYSRFGASKPVYITETNTQWYFGPWDGCLRYSEDSYRPGWLKEAFTAIDCWNKANDIKICALCWYVWASQCSDRNVCDQHQNSLERLDNWRLTAARNDFFDTTKNRLLVAGFPGDIIRVQAEHYTNSDTREARGYTNGLSGIDYYDTTAGNEGGWFRTEDVDIMRDASGGHFIYRTSPGEWLRYESLFGGRWYKLRVNFARPFSGGSRINFWIDGINRFQMTLDDPDDLGETFHLQESLNSVYVPEGVHNLRLEILDGRLYIDWFELVPVASGGPQ